MTEPATTAPAAYGRAYAEVLHTATTLTNAQAAALLAAYEARVTDPARCAEPDSPFQAGRRLNGVRDLLDFDGAPADQDTLTLDVCFAVLARDRGLITERDYAMLTAPWVDTGLPLPDVTTTDQVAEELLHAAGGNDKLYGATMMLTGYNYGELLAYESVRQFLSRDSGTLALDWAGLGDALKGDALDDLTEEARHALYFAVGLRMPDEGNTGYLFFTVPEDGDTAEVMALAFARTIGADLTPHPEIEFVPVEPAAAIPGPRVATEPGE